MDYLTTRATVAALQAREVSAVELLDRSIARIVRHDAQVNALAVQDFERARLDAAAADGALRRGERRPLLGVPVSVKEAFDVAGLPTTWGIPGTQQALAAEDAVVVRRLKAAGAVVIGKTNVALQLADWQTFNPLYGVTRNPWNLDRTPGGSSGGAAAALAAGYVSLEVGTDLAGSLRVPAHCCGVFAHKPTHGLVPMRGSAPPGAPRLSLGVDIDIAVAGPMARSAGDLALALDVLAGPDDAEAIAYRLALPPARHDALGSFRVLVLDQHPRMPTAMSVRRPLQRMADALREAGCQVAHQSPLLPDLARATVDWGRLVSSLIGADMPPDDYRQLAAVASGLAPDDASDAAIGLRSMVMSHRDWIHRDRVRTATAHQWRQFFQRWDVLLCPVMPTCAFAHDHGDMQGRRLLVDGEPLPTRRNRAGPPSPVSRACRRP